MNFDLLNYVHLNSSATTLDFSEKFGIDHQVAIGILKALEASEKLQSEVKSYNKLELTDEGLEISKNGSYEYHIFSAIPIEGIARDKLIKTSNDKIGFAKAMTNKWIGFTDKDGVKLVTRQVDFVEDVVRMDLENISGLGDNSLINEYKKRKLLRDVTSKYFLIRKGPKFSLDIDQQEEIAIIDAEMAQRTDIDWDNIKFKKFNVHGARRKTNANLHPLLKMRAEYARILVEMGFQEMPTNNYVESSFWNFDALFQPQDHAARDAHDTFFLTNPATSDKFPLEYLHRVKQVHSNGGYGSQGYRNPWKHSEAEKNLMRTHTTAVSARMLYKLAQQEQFSPVRYYSIDRVFRNESLDATHLAEFHQVEGLIADRGATLGYLKYVIRTFFTRLGMEKIKFKPAYNPYTEPSMEIFYYHEGLGRYIEIGNSGMFRPEMLLPMGLPEDVNVIAWGLSLERPTMIKYGINDIREMMGPRMDLSKVFSDPICRI